MYTIHLFRVMIVYYIPKKYNKKPQKVRDVNY